MAKGITTLEEIVQLSYELRAKDTGLTADEIKEREKTPTFLSSGSLVIDEMLGGGYLGGAMTLLFGEANSGKSTLALMAAREATLLKKKVLYIDTENSYDNQWGAKLGIDLNYMYVARASNVERAVGFMTLALKDKDLGLIVYDSIAAAGTSAHVDKDDGESEMKGPAMVWSNYTKQRALEIYDRQVPIILVAPIRDNMDGNSKIKIRIPGGQDVRFRSKVIAQISRKREQIASGVDYSTIYVNTRNTYCRNKVTGVEDRIEIKFIDKINGEDFYDVDRIDEIFKLSKKHGLFLKEDGSSITTAGKYHYQGEYLGKSESEVKEYLGQNQNVAIELMGDLQKVFTSNVDLSLVNDREDVYDDDEYTDLVTDD